MSSETDVANWKGFIEGLNGKRNIALLNPNCQLRLRKLAGYLKTHKGPELNAYNMQLLDGTSNIYRQIFEIKQGMAAALKSSETILGQFRKLIDDVNGLQRERYDV